MRGVPGEMAPNGVITTATLRQGCRVSRRPLRPRPKTRSPIRSASALHRLHHDRHRRLHAVCGDEPLQIRIHDWAIGSMTVGSSSRPAPCALRVSRYMRPRAAAKRMERGRGDPPAGRAGSGSCLGSAGKPNRRGRGSRSPGRGGALSRERRRRAKLLEPAILIPRMDPISEDFPYGEPDRATVISAEIGDPGTSSGAEIAVFSGSAEYFDLTGGANDRTFATLRACIHRHSERFSFTTPPSSHRTALRTHGPWPRLDAWRPHQTEPQSPPLPVPRSSLPNGRCPFARRSDGSISYRSRTK
jgi:hypothetical protein